MSMIFRRLRQGEASNHWTKVAFLVILGVCLLLAVRTALNDIRKTDPAPRGTPPLSYYETVPDVPLGNLSASQKHDFVLKLNSTRCTCKCGMNVAQCRNVDPSCKKSIEIALSVLKDFSSSE